MNIYQVSIDEKEQIKRLAEQVKLCYSRADDNEFLTHAYIWAGDLPYNIREQLVAIKSDPYHCGVTIFRGVKCDTEWQATPKSWNIEDTYTPDRNSDFISVIFASLIGEPFGFETQQSGKLIHDTVPIKGKEYFQAGCSSLGKLSFHTEDAFHPHRGEFLCFNCIKNPTDRGTSGASVRSLNLPPHYRKVLHQERFYTLPDNTHADNTDEYQVHSILFGNCGAPYIRIDPDFTYAVEGDEEAREALAYLINEVDSKIIEIPLEPGDFAFIDNYQWVHGRQPFIAKFDGNDRWLKRLNITLDLKRTAGYRSDKNSRIISAAPVHGQSAD